MFVHWFVVGATARIYQEGDKPRHVAVARSLAFTRSEGVGLIGWLDVFYFAVKSLLPKHEGAIFCIDLDGLSFADFAFEDVDTQRIENFLLNGAP
jgi:hypothetical protein